MKYERILGMHLEGEMWTDSPIHTQHAYGPDTL